jgi:hypothetical protein
MIRTSETTLEQKHPLNGSKPIDLIVEWLAKRIPGGEL